MSDAAVSTVMSIYDAFGRGDVPTILGHLADDVRWDHGIRRTAVPYLQEATGHDAVVEFFRRLDDQLEFLTFEITSVTSSGSEVFTRVRLAGRNKHTGLLVPEYPEAHHFVFDDHGKVAAFTHIGDWAAHEAAAPGAARPGDLLHVVGETLDVEASGGQFEVFTARGPRDSGPPPHSHPWREVYVGVVGETDVTVDDRTTTLRAGDVICVEAGVTHTFRVVSDGATFVVITGGGLASEFFVDMDANAPRGVPDEASLGLLAAVAMRNGLSSPLFDSVLA